MTGAERRAILERFAAGPRRVASAALDAQAGRLAGAVRRRPEGWSEREIVAHLVRVEREVFRVRLRQLVDEDEPHWQWVEPGAGPYLNLIGFTKPGAVPGVPPGSKRPGR